MRRRTESTEEYVPAGLRYTVGGEDMEEYLKGVVAAEMPVSFPLDALKAQAVASRTYAVRAVENAEFELAPAGHRSGICDGGKNEGKLGREF